MAKLSRKLLRAAKRAAPPVPYKWGRQHFRSGDLIAQSHGGWSTWKDIQVSAVRIGTMSTYSHVGVVEVDQSDGRVYVVEAVRPCARRVPLSSIGSFYHLPMPQARWTYATCKFVQSILGSPYSRWDAIKAFFSPLPAGSVSECAALTREVLQRAGVDLGPMSRPDAVVQRALELGSSLAFIVNGGNK